MVKRVKAFCRQTGKMCISKKWLLNPCIETLEPLDRHNDRMCAELVLLHSEMCEMNNLDSVKAFSATFGLELRVS